MSEVSMVGSAVIDSSRNGSVVSLCVKPWLSTWCLSGVGDVGICCLEGVLNLERCEVVASVFAVVTARCLPLVSGRGDRWNVSRTPDTILRTILGAEVCLGLTKSGEVDTPLGMVSHGATT